MAVRLGCGAKAVCTLQNELSNIRSILFNNGYPEAVINAVITPSVTRYTIVPLLKINATVLSITHTP